MTSRSFIGREAFHVVSAALRCEDAEPDFLHR